MITTTKLTKTFNNFTALKEVTCQIPKGCIYGMVGSNGAGKSTFLRILTGVYQPTSGTATIEDTVVFDSPEVKERITYVPDTLYFLPGATMKRMAQFYSDIYTNFDMNRFNELTKAFRLDPSKPISHFSKGMQRQTAIILALSSKPDYMFFDETFDGLDPIMRALVKKLICQDVIDRNATIIITSHSLRELEDICDQLALLHEGGLILQSDIENLKTTQFKVQIAFKEEYDESLFSELSYLRFQKSGSVSNMIVKGDKDSTIAYLQAKNPALLDVLPLTLDEVFTFEMEALGYNFDDIVRKESSDSE